MLHVLNISKLCVSDKVCYVFLMIFKKSLQSVPICSCHHFCFLSPNIMMHSPGGSAAKDLLATQETQETRAQSFGQETPLEKEMAICSSILAWGFPQTEEPGGLSSMGLKKSQTQLSN